ncbi:conjugal transfer protein TraN [Photobacterium sp. ZSDE20]|uniref:Conjugal transfer protein TraN n=1 Tax=Photobacterium pectinilyticum TaxID=2906793 RepID=A0ABT1N699_9GAMM|nr:conjugal transfer protein TraN [Photobacterium sp. ZSDE20]MCQ1060278.1 conjugal transfer protein TraN [Photobacterium sp. ZSDE20]
MSPFLTPSWANATASTGAPQATCPPGFSNNSGQCSKFDEAPITPYCEPGYTYEILHDEAYGMVTASCTKPDEHVAYPECGVNEESRHNNFTRQQECRYNGPRIDGACPAGSSWDWEKNACIGTWAKPSTFYCEDDSADLDEILGEMTGTCTPIGAAEGLCEEGETIQLTMPGWLWELREGKDPDGTQMCERTLYDHAEFNCPRPNEEFPAGPGEPIYEYPRGIHEDNPRYFDEANNPSMCIMTTYTPIETKCPDGTIHHTTTNTCRAADSVTCPEDTTYQNGMCYGDDIYNPQCPLTHIYDELSRTCVPQPPEEGHDFDSAYNAGGDLGWMLGSLQSGKVQRSTEQGNLTLDMGLVNAEANKNLQDNAADLRDFNSIGDHDINNNTYSDIGGTYGNQTETKEAILANHSSFLAYLASDEEDKVLNTAAEAYGVFEDTANENRPPSIDSDSDIINNIRDIVGGTVSGDDPWFGDCSVESRTIWELNPDKQVITEDNCTAPVKVNYESCRADRILTPPTLRILEGAEDARVEIIDNYTIRLTIGKMCNNCLTQRPGENCSMYGDKVRIKIDEGINVERAEMTSAIWDDHLKVYADEHLIFRRAHGIWEDSGFPTTDDYCERSISHGWNGIEDVTEEFQQALEADQEITFEYIVAVGGGGEGRASVNIRFDKPITNQWQEEIRHFPAGCNDRLASSQCDASGWVCDAEFRSTQEGFGHINISNMATDSHGYGLEGDLGDVLYLVAKREFEPSDGLCGMVVATTFNYADGNNDDGLYVCDNMFVQGTFSTNSRGYRGVSLTEIIPEKDKWELFAVRTTGPGPVFYKLDENGTGITYDWRVMRGGDYDSLIHSGYKIGRNIMSFDWPRNANKPLWFSYWSVDHNPTDREVFLKLASINFEEPWIDFAPLWEADTSIPSKWPEDPQVPICLRAHAEDMYCNPIHDGPLITDDGQEWTWDDIQAIPNTCEPLIGDSDCQRTSITCEDGFEVTVDIDGDIPMTVPCSIERILTPPPTSDGYWEEEFVYHPPGCELRQEDEENCTPGEWECVHSRSDDYLKEFPDVDSDEITNGPSYPLDFPSWSTWDTAGNWVVYNNGWSVRQTVNTSRMTVYGSDDVQGFNIYTGDILVDDDKYDAYIDDDTIGFIFGYPENPNWNGDPDDPDSHYYVLAWTSSIPPETSNLNTRGIALYKSFEPYGNQTAFNYHTDTDKQKVLASNRDLWWQQKVKYGFEIHFSHDLIKIRINGDDIFVLEEREGTFHSGKMGFIGHSQANGHYENMAKYFEDDYDPGDMVGYPGFDDIGKTDNIWKPLFPGADEVPACMVGRINGMKCLPTESTEQTRCLVERHNYTCVDNSNAWEERILTEEEAGCNIVIPCMDGECGFRGDEQNADFNDALLQLSVVNEMRHQMNCVDPGDPSTCTVFSGEQRDCSYDQFGLIDCCKEFKGKTIDLFRLAMQGMKVGSWAVEVTGIGDSFSQMMWGTESTDGWIPDDWWGTKDTIHGSWSKVSDTVSGVGDGIQNAWGSAVDTTTGWFAPATENTAGVNTQTDTTPKNSDGSNVSGEGADWGNVVKNKAEDAVEGEVKKVLIDKAAEFINDYLPEFLKDAILEAGRMMGMEIGLETQAGEVISQGMGQLASLLGAAATIYAAIQIAMMLYQLFNGCEDDQMDMPQVLKEKKCWFAYRRKCTKNFAGLCTNKHRKRHCCFPSVLSKIIVRDAITQEDVFGRSYSPYEWYEDADKKCRGLTIEEVSKVDFNKINMEEYFELMLSSGILPGTGDTIEEWTSEKSMINPYGRSDAISRQGERNVEDFNEGYRVELDDRDVLEEVDCSQTPNILSCEMGIYR